MKEEPTLSFREVRLYLPYCYLSLLLFRPVSALIDQLSRICICADTSQDVVPSTRLASGLRWEVAMNHDQPRPRRLPESPFALRQPAVAAKCVPVSLPVLGPRSETRNFHA
ncbi:hypothetical protein J6590_055995 [Homalodisca vitripennis]|nr:hypothetical protein J6590_055995 [Homalodisca vitripennis]